MSRNESFTGNDRPREMQEELIQIIVREMVGDLKIGPDLRGVCGLILPNHTNREKVFRLNGEHRKLSIFRDPILRNNFETHASDLGLSLDTFISKFYDWFGETAMNLFGDAYHKSFMRHAALKQWSTARLHHFISNGKPTVRIYRFGREQLIKSPIPNFRPYGLRQFSRLELSLLVPGEIANFLSGARGRELFSDISRVSFFRALFCNFLKVNGVMVPTAKFGSHGFHMQLKAAIDHVSEIDIWKPYGWYAPPMRHNRTDLDGRCLMFSFLSRSNTFGDRKQRLTVELPLDSESDPLRFLLPYVSQRLWRNPSELFTLMLLFLIETRGLLPYYPLDLSPDSKFFVRFKEIVGEISGC